jgi:CheY-like chemotaxis protein
MDSLLENLDLTYVVEDDPITATLTKLLLEKNLQGSRVQTYANGQQALDQLSWALQRNDAGEVPDLILLDLNMPMMDGWEFLDALSRLPLGRPVCVLILTSSINTDDQTKASRYQHVGGYFAKPLDMSGLARMLRLRRAANGPGAVTPLEGAAPLHHLLYQSQATTPMSETQLTELLIQSRAYNAAHSLTGVLLYSHGHIVQLLEGSEAAVHEVFARIARDPRHNTVVKLADGPVAQRQFDQWSMGFRVVNPQEFSKLTGYINPNEQNYLDPTASLPDSDLQLLLAAFVSDSSVAF